MTGPARTETEIEFCQKYLGLKKNHSILDAPCGAGRHSLQMAQLGYTVIGVDFSNYLLSRAVHKAGKLPVQVPYPHFIRGLLQKIPVQSNSFKSIICMFSSFGYGDTEIGRAHV